MSEQPGTESIWLINQGVVRQAETKPPRSEANQKAHEKTIAIISYLKSKSLYAPKDIRDLLLRQLLEIPSLELPVAKLFRSVSTMAQAKALTEGLSFEHWRPAVDSVTNLAIKAGVLLDSASAPILDSFTARGTTVVKVEADIINKCDCFLMVTIIDGIPGLTTRDAPSIAHALFKEAPSKISQDDMIDRVHDVLSQLAGKLDQGQDGILTVI